MRSRSSSPKVLVLNSNSQFAMAEPSNNPPMQLSSRGANNDLGSKKQEASHHHGSRQHQQSSSGGARQKVFRPGKGGTQNAHLGRRGGRASSSLFKTPASKEMKSPESGSVYKAGSKKSCNNFNHLLNFDYGPHRGVNDARRAYRQGNEVLPGRRKAPSQKYTKEHYLQANCQFLVRAEKDISAQLDNPDLPLEWENIEMVTHRTNDHPSCPICLYQPKAAKMTRCGHIYCWQCILHYLALSDDDWRKCPICEECISKQDLKSVVTVPFSEHGIGDEIEMDLMRRSRSSLFAYPVTKFAEEYEGKFPNVSQEYTSYSRIVTASPQEIVSRIIENEKKTLLECYEYDKDEPESCFILEALNSLEERGKMLEDIEDQVPINMVEKLSLEHLKESASLPTFENLRSGLEQATAGDTKPQPLRKEFFNFYQSSDGQKIFLHGLNAKMLERQFGDLNQAPFSIRGRILEKEIVTVTEELRSKYRYLKHLPLLCNIEFVELELLSVEFEEDVREEFRQQVDDRKRKRHRKARDERKREKKILIEENKIMGKYPDPKYRIESNYHFPDIGQEMTGMADSSTHNESDGAATFAKIIRQRGPPPPRAAPSRSESFPTLSQGVIPHQLDSDGEEAPPSFVPLRPSLNLDLSTGVVVVKNKRGKKKSTNLVKLSSAPRPLI